MVGIQLNSFNMEKFKYLFDEQPLKVELLESEWASDNQIDYSKLRAVFYSAHAPFVDLCLCSLDREIRTLSRARFEKYLQFVTRLGISRVVLHHNIFPSLSPQSNVFIAITNDFLAYLDDVQRTYDVEIYIENVLDRHPETLAWLMEHNQNPHIAICFDVAHAFLSSTPIETWLLILKPWIRHVHLCDCKNLFYDEHIACGDGLINWRQPMLRELINREDVVSIIEVPDILRAEKSLRFLTNFIL